MRVGVRSDMDGGRGGRGQGCGDSESESGGSDKVPGQGLQRQDGTRWVRRDLPRQAAERFDAGGGGERCPGCPAERSDGYQEQVLVGVGTHQRSHDLLTGRKDPRNGPAGHGVQADRDAAQENGEYKQGTQSPQDVDRPSVCEAIHGWRGPRTPVVRFAVAVPSARRCSMPMTDRNRAGRVMVTWTRMEWAPDEVTVPV